MIKKQKQNTIANQQKESGRKEKTLYFCTANRTFFYILDKRSTFLLAVNPTN